jgi:hypothetical protein
LSGAVVAFLGFAAMLGLIAIRMPVGLAMWVVGTAGYVHFMGVGAFMQWIKTTPYHLFANFTLSVIPLFILMGIVGLAFLIVIPLMGIKREDKAP